MNKTSKLLVGAPVVALVVVCGLLLLRALPNLLVGGGIVEKTSRDSIGTATSETEINTTFASSTDTVLATYMDNLHLDISFTPNATDTYLLLFVEASNDGGTTFFPLTTKSVGATEILTYVEGSDGSVGIPLIFPGDKTSTASTQYKGALDYDVVADYIKISAKASTGTSTAYVRTTLSSK